MPGYTLTWDGNASTMVPGIIIERVRRNLIGAVRDSPVPIPGRDGAYVFPERRGDRTITASGVIVAAPAARHAAVVALADWLDRAGRRKLVISDQPDRYWMASVSTDPDPDEWRSTARFELQWIAEPYAYAQTTTTVCVTATNGSPQTLSLPGNVDAETIVQITPLNGTLAGAPSFTLTVNGDMLAYSGTVAQGATLTINGLTNTVTTGPNTDLELTGVYVPGTVFPGDVAGDFPLLQPGSNPWALAWGGTATQVRVCFTYRRRYR
jgi:predicted phage tail component-like protein